MEQQQRHKLRQSWDVCREVPIIQDELKPRKRVQCLKLFSCAIVGVIVFALVLLSKTSFLLLITFGNNQTEIICSEQKPATLLGIGFVLVGPSVLLLLKSTWKFIFKSATMPSKKTLLWVLCVEFLVALGAAVLTIVAMPHFDIVTNVMILNSVSILSAVFQVVAKCLAKEKKWLIMLSVCSIFLTVTGYVFFAISYLVFESSLEINISIGLAIIATICVSVNWWENYSTLFAVSFLEDISRDIAQSRNVVCIISSLMRILVTSAVVGAYVPLSGREWKSVKLVFETVIVSLVVIQIASSALCRWFVVVACKMHALRCSFVLPMYLASITVLAVFLIPTSVRLPDSNQTSTCFENFQPKSSDSWLHLMLTDAIRTLNTRDIVVHKKTGGLVCLGCSALSWWLGLMLSTVYIWYLKIHRIERTQDLFVRPMFEGTFLEQSMLLNTRFEIRKRIKEKKCAKETIKVFLCATMWHETYDEMMKIIISMFRLDKYRPKTDKHSDVKFEFHIFFDDAFKDVDNERHANEYAEILVDVIKEVYTIFSEEDPCIFKQKAALPHQKIINTPYGGRLEYTLPKGNLMMVHLKDKTLIRHKKRWSQIMYLYYILGWRLNRQYFKEFEAGKKLDSLWERLKKDRENTYILALDGDTDFQPSAVMLLIDRLKLYPDVGAACGRIHPTGTGPMVWYQKFEYAVGHWLQKTAEHVFGCVLCSPGCFSLFRGAALMDDNVMKRYTTKASEASHYIQYDQGEDRWLCTLLLQQGWRVEYNAASDAYTNAPQDFKEFYNQRRRWGPSTMANTIDLLGSGGLTSQRNSSISKPYILYQIISMAASILGPATICLMISGSFVFILNMDKNIALALAIVPPTVYLILCFKLKSDTQIKIAAIMSVLYAFLMAGTILSIIGDLVKQKTFLTPSGLFLIGMVVFYIITAALHPQEFSLVIYGLLYFLCIPSGYLLLVIYSIVNMNNVTWGTRETGSQTKTTAVDTIKKKVMNATCCKCPCLESEDLSEKTLPAEEITQRECEFQLSPHQTWIEQLQMKSYEFPLDESELASDEVDFWEELQKKYLEPFKENKEQQEKIADDLRELRNKVTFAFFFCNALWLVATFSLQAIGDSVSLKIPKIYLNGTYDPTEVFSLDPIALMFLLSFASLLLMQFVAMLYHRIYTLIHFVAYADTEIKSDRKQSHLSHQILDSNHQPETHGPDSALCFQNPSSELHRNRTTRVLSHGKCKVVRTGEVAGKMSGCFVKMATNVHILYVKRESFSFTTPSAFSQR
ncbi:chitin synthase chs-1-like isoform X3 [Onychostoma macrolepis]|uniref:chitin synthase chs-1-like isoform X3 n=1 Tax=Onychostoma macrolepis TaxID=369639 RepID=UPI00272A213B|nr:chitin synthase chs-1-like isoform X3 [Onychostoma macrolepis]